MDTQTHTHVRGVGAFKPLLVPGGSLLGGGRVPGVLGHPLSLGGAVHGPHGGPPGPHHTPWAHPWGPSRARVGQELGIVRGSTTHLSEKGNKRNVFKKMLI